MNKKRKNLTILACVVMVIGIIGVGIMIFAPELTPTPYGYSMDNAPAEPTPESEETPAEEIEETEPVDAIEDDTEDVGMVNTDNTGYAYDSAHYINNNVLTCPLTGEFTLKVGVDVPEYGTGLVLNPVCEWIKAREDMIPRFGFYITSDNANINCSGHNTGSKDSEQFSTTNYYVITNRTYDTLVSAQFNSMGDYGVEWSLAGIDEENRAKTDTVYLRVIDLENDLFVGVAHIDIAYDEEQHGYRITNLYCSDSRYFTDITEEQRTSMLKTAKAFFTGGSDFFSIALPVDEWDTALEKAMVERIPHTYFPQLYNIRSNAIRGSAIDKYDLFAVNIPYHGVGVFTAYFTLEHNISGYYREIEGVEERYMMIAYDPLSPFSQSTFIDGLYPDDIEFFTQEAE